VHLTKLEAKNIGGIFFLHDVYQRLLLPSAFATHFRSITFRFYKRDYVTNECACYTDDIYDETDVLSSPAKLLVPLHRKNFLKL